MYYRKLKHNSTCKNISAVNPVAPLSTWWHLLDLFDQHLKQNFSANKIQSLRSKFVWQRTWTQTNAWFRASRFTASALKKSHTMLHCREHLTGNYNSYVTMGIFEFSCSSSVAQAQHTHTTTICKSRYLGSKRLLNLGHNEGRICHELNDHVCK